MEDLIIYQDAVAIGLAVPSTVYGRAGSKHLINGPRGITQLLDDSEHSLLSALKESGSFIPGTPDEIAAVCKLISDPLSSRTVSYLLCTAGTCAKVIECMGALSCAHVIVLGCGGIGSSLAMLLAGAGVQQLTLIDPDRIELSNLNRQLFWERKDVGEFKVEILKSAISKRFENVVVNIYAQEMGIDGIYPLAKNGVSGLAVTADSPGTLAWDANRVSREIKIPVVSGGYFHQHCVANFFCPLTENNLETADDIASIWTRLPSSVMPSYGPTNMALAAILCSALISGMTGTMPQGNKIMRWDSSVHPHDIRLC